MYDVSAYRKRLHHRFCLHCGALPSMTELRSDAQLTKADVARHAGVSIATVSRLLHQTPTAHALARRRIHISGLCLPTIGSALSRPKRSLSFCSAPTSRPGGLPNSVGPDTGGHDRAHHA
ncbi:MAG TPA: LacI family DNA-binding transcriptional regulator [Anaerolineae bacterium]|nr:LacI family DNA-binding transcriptional regulator [Anaerolineae bacterium]